MRSIVKEKTLAQTMNALVDLLEYRLSCDVCLGYLGKPARLSANTAVFQDSLAASIVRIEGATWASI